MKKLNLAKQLICIILLIFLIIFASVGYILPNVLLPIYESNIYTILRQPLDLVNSENFISPKENKIAFIYVADDKILISNNLKDIINLSPKKILNKTNEAQGNFQYRGKNYYYTLDKENDVIKVALTNDDYFNTIKNNIINTIFPILFYTFLIIIGLVLLWSQLLISKIENLKHKIDNLDNDNYKRPKMIKKILD